MLNFSYKSTLILVLTVISLGFSCQNKKSNELKPGDSIHLMIMSTTDVHGWILPYDYSKGEIDQRYGLAKAAFAIDSLRKIYTHTLLLDAGDWLQGNAMADYFAKVDSSERNFPFLSVVDHLKYDALVIGNHEFNYGLDYLNKRIEMTSTPIIAANAIKKGSNESAFPPYVIRDFHGVKVGVLGLTTPGSMIWDGRHLDGKLEIREVQSMAQSLVNELKELGCHIIVALAHSGYEMLSSYNAEDVPVENFGEYLANDVDGIDLIVLGHSHTITEKIIDRQDGKSVPIIQAGRWGDHLATALLTITYDRKQGMILKVDEEINIIPTIQLPVDSGVYQLVANAHEEVIAYLDATLASTTQVWDLANAISEDNALIDLIQNAMLYHAEADIAVASIFNRSARIDSGEIRRRDLNAIYPYENTLFVLEVTGDILKSYLEHSVSIYSLDGKEIRLQPKTPLYNLDFAQSRDLYYEVDLRKKVGDRIRNLKYQEKEVAPSQTFRLAVNSYRAAGGGGYSMLSGAPVLYQSEKSIREMLESYLLHQKEIEIEREFYPNWKLIR